MLSTLEIQNPAPMSDTASKADALVSRILVVDDTEANRDLLVRRLQRGPYHVSVARNGREALELLRREPIDVMLLDIMMPEMDGYAVLEQLRREPVLGAVRVIMISAVDELDSVVRCLALGADDYLPKPFNPTLLRARLESSLERKRLRDRERSYARSLERELEIGREIQAQFLPSSMPAAPGWELEGFLRPARQVSGDFYDAFPLGSTGAVGLILADVCDKGVGAALFMALYRTLLRSTCEESELPAPQRLCRALERTNNYIAHIHGQSSMFATVFFAILDQNTGTLTYTNAGHEAPLLRRSSGAIEPLASTGPAVGMLPGLDFGIGTTTLEPGDVLVAFTDGITEARNSSGALYTEQRLLASLATPAPGARQLLASITAEVEFFAGDAPQSDDLTLLVVQRTAEQT